MTQAMSQKMTNNQPQADLSGKNLILERFAAEAKVWADEKVKYRHRGTTKRGADCTGLIIGIARSLGYLGKYELRNYPPDWNLHAGSGNYICDELDKVGFEIPNSQAQNGDIPIFRFGKCLAHAGIIVKMKSRIFVHSFYTARRCEYGILRNSRWSERWMKTYRLSDEKMAIFS